MGYAPTDLISSDYLIAQKPTLGGEKRVYISNSRAVQVADEELVAASSGVFTPDPANLPDQVSGSDLVAIIDNQTGVYAGASNIVLTVNGLDNTASPITGTATFKVPAYAKDQTRRFEPGYAVDVIQASGKKFKSITSITVTNDAAAKGGRIVIFAMPPQSSFTQLGCVEDMGWTGKESVPVSIACGMDAAAFSKPGRSSVPGLSLSTKQFSFGDGLSKYAGATCTLWVKVIKEGRLNTDNIYFLEATLSAPVRMPAGEGEVMLEASGLYEDVAIMPAM